MSTTLAKKVNELRVRIHRLGFGSVLPSVSGLSSKNYNVSPTGEGKPIIHMRIPIHHVQRGLRKRVWSFWQLGNRG